MKGEVRKAIKLAMSKYRAQDLAADGQKALAFFKQLPLWQDACNIFSFAPLPRNEFQVDRLNRLALTEGKNLFLPAICQDSLYFAHIPCQPDEDYFDYLVATDIDGLYQPVAKLLAVDYSKLSGPSLILVPGLGFDRDKNRLGRGGGFYDRFLADIRRKQLSITSIGMAGPGQLIQGLPIDEHDEKLDYIYNNGCIL